MTLLEQMQTIFMDVDAGLFLILAQLA